MCLRKSVNMPKKESASKILQLWAIIAIQNLPIMDRLELQVVVVSVCGGSQLVMEKRMAIAEKECLNFIKVEKIESNL